MQDKKIKFFQPVSSNMFGATKENSLSENSNLGKIIQFHFWERLYSVSEIKNYLVGHVVCRV